MVGGCKQGAVAAKLKVVAQKLHDLPVVRKRSGVHESDPAAYIE
jgi:hypothetical protein